MGNNTSQPASPCGPKPDQQLSKPRKRIVIAMTGATGAILGIHMLIALRMLNVETHLVTSKWAEATCKHETDYNPSNIRGLADFAYRNSDMAASIASGSFRSDGMIIIPCSMKTLAAVSCGFDDDLISRTADVMLKERRKLVLVVRETPLNTIHLRNMLSVSESGGIIFPPVPAFYTHPAQLLDVVDHLIGRVLDLFDLDTGNVKRWQGFVEAR
ncbi:UbiX family flavin prenyltransferase [Aspergillus alliaceus]|uniref:UbiX family flavin prenyltransferase n=1 Tax=Petromyces alliaceus TaxID=209559 RepID=UPI0012A4C94F|nr:flavo protein [Aspergillus alliaceus]KAB8228396.1 flavo protein [Aspergillus alliaceus]